MSLEKVEGGSGESFLKNAARQLNINFDKEARLDEIARAHGVDYSELSEIYDKVAREMNIGNDTVLITQGASVAPIVAAVSDPAPTYNVNLQTAAAGVDIPTRILVGNQQAERSSTEDQKYFNTRCQSRRGDLSFEVEDFCDKLIELSILDPVSQKTVIWDDLNAQSDSEKLDAAQKMSQINSASIGTGEQVFTGEEIRVAAGYEGSPEPLPEVDDDEEESEVTDTSGKP
ncbi:gp5 [Enterobacter hormaechei]|nr:gp5 [Enterobacter hormaechei]SAB87631.1 gp5 [Enterobacter hormaechei]SAF88984.1 gp5 [Enterobacter hormaechei]